MDISEIFCLKITECIAEKNTTLKRVLGSFIDVIYISDVFVA